MTHDFPLTPSDMKQMEQFRKDMQPTMLGKPLPMIDLPAIRDRAAAFEAAQNAATEGPWYVHNPDDWMAMNVVCVTNDADEPDTHVGARDDGFNRDIIAMTLYQAHPIAAHRSSKWFENAEFIALARITTLAADVRGLCERVEELERANDVALVAEMIGNGWALRNTCLSYMPMEGTDKDTMEQYSNGRILRTIEGKWLVSFHGLHHGEFETLRDAFERANELIAMVNRKA